MEFARSGLLDQDTIKVDIGSLTQGKLFYVFKNKNTIQRGHYKLNHNPIPKKLALYPAYPNPFNPVTTFRFDIPFSLQGSQKMALLIYDVQGREVETLLNQKLMPGAHKVNWYPKTHASSVYFVQLQYGEMIKTQKVIYLK